MQRPEEMLVAHTGSDDKEKGLNPPFSNKARRLDEISKTLGWVNKAEKSDRWPIAR
jgi:hypothetical protein